MKGHGNNVKDPTKISIMDLLNEVSAWHNPTVVPCTQEFYDLLQTRDPHTIYVIIDAKVPVAYYGDIQILHKELSTRYFMAPCNEHKGEYVMYINNPDGWSDSLWEVCRFDDPQKALDALFIYNKVGSHHHANIEIYKSIVNFINEEITLNHLIIGCFCAFGYNDGNSNLQEVNSTVYRLSITWTNDERYGKDFHPEVSKAVSKFKSTSERTGNYIYGMYLDIYNVMLKYNFFLDEKYHKDEAIYLGDVIKDIIEIFYKSPILIR